MEVSGYPRSRETPRDSVASYMNPYQRSVARQGVEEAMMLGDLGLRAWSRVRAAFGRANQGLAISHTQR